MRIWVYGYTVINMATEQKVKCWRCGEELVEYLQVLFKKGKVGPYCDQCAYEMEKEGKRF